MFGKPNTYEVLEYLESNGTQWIDTEVNATTNNKFEFIVNGCFTDTQKNTQLHGIFGGGYFGTTSGKWTCGTTGATIATDNADTNKHTFELSTTISSAIVPITLKVDDVTYSNKRRIAAGKVLLFNCDGNNTAYICFFRAYLAQVLINNTLVRDFIPVRRLSDGELGMYDTVTKQFFTNQGTGTFIAGEPTGRKF